jgi:hypothetical protein
LNNIMIIKISPTILFITIILFFFNNVNGQDIQQLKNEKLAVVTGTIGASATAYTSNGIVARRVPFSWAAYANINVKLKGIDLPFSFYFTEQNRDFRQPFNQFGLSPKYKNIQLHLGYRNVQYSNYTLNGHTFLGAGVDYKLHRFSMAAMYGRFLKAIAEDSTKGIINNGSQFPYASYNRMGYSVKLGYGTTNNYINIIYLNAKDDLSSLAVRPVKIIVAPAANAVIGLKTKLTIAKKITWELDAALSGYTKDVRAKDYPIDEEPLLEKINKILPVKLSTSVYYAGESSIGYSEKNYGIKLKYQRILPDYKSMGMYFIQTDVDRKTLEGRWSDNKNLLSLSGSFGIEKDNLTARKLASTSRNIGSINLNYNPSAKYGVSVSFMNYGTTQSPGLKSISDTVRLDQVTNSIIITPRYTISKPNAIHNVVINLSNQSLNDKNKFNSSNFQMNVSNVSVTYVITLLKSNISFDATPFYVLSKISGGEAISMGGNAGASKSFLKNKLTTNLSASYSTNQFNKIDNGFTLQGRFNSSYRVSKHHKLQIQLIHVVNESKATVVSKSFNESTGTLQYAYSF